MKKRRFREGSGAWRGSGWQAGGKMVVARSESVDALLDLVVDGGLLDRGLGRFRLLGGGRGDARQGLQGSGLSGDAYDGVSKLCIHSGF